MTYGGIEGQLIAETRYQQSEQERFVILKRGRYRLSTCMNMIQRCGWVT